MSFPDELSTPSGFAVGVLGKRDLYTPEGVLLEKRAPYPWQCKVIDSFVTMPKAPVKVTLRAPNGTGKSSYCVADLALWCLSMFPRARVVISTADGKQLDHQIWPAIEQHKDKFALWDWKYREIHTDTGGELIAFCTDEAGRAEGWHRLPTSRSAMDGPLLIIIDEAKSFSEDKFVAIDRCSYDGLFLCSSTGLMEGRFFDTHHSIDGYIRVRAGLADCPNVRQSKIDDIQNIYGPDSPVARSILHAEFMNFDGVSKFVFQIDHLQSLKNSNPQVVGGDCVAFCDFAAGGDENVLAVRRGNKVTVVDAWRDEDTMRAVYRFITNFRKEKLKPTQIYGDDDGLGGVMIDAMGEQGWKINRFNNNAKPRNEGYERLGAEVWHETAGMVRRGEIILPLEDDLLFKQLANRKVDWGPRGLSVKSKRKMKADGESSPDRGDAVCAAAVLKDVMSAIAENERIHKRWQDFGVPAGGTDSDKGAFAHLEAMI